MKLTHALLLSFAIALPLSAQVGIYIRSAPPPVRYEERQPEPGPGYVWVDGYWAPHGHHYRWMAGHWDQTPYEGAYWSHPHYDHYQQGWQIHEGHWDREDHDRNHGRDYGRDRADEHHHDENHHKE